MTTTSPETSSPATVIAVDRAELLWLDPRDLAAHPSNVRADLTDLAASIKTVGILEPIIVTPTDDGYRMTEWIMASPNLSAGEEEAVAALVGPAPSSPHFGRAAGPHAVTQATDSRLPLILLAQVAADAETGCHDYAWRHDRPIEAAKWLSWLNSVGYSLSEIETKVVTAGTKTDRRPRQTPRPPQPRPRATESATRHRLGAGHKQRPSPLVYITRLS